MLVVLSMGGNSEVKIKIIDDHNGRGVRQGYWCTRRVKTSRDISIEVKGGSGES